MKRPPLKVWLNGILLFLLPTGLARLFVNRLGWQLDQKARVGFSLLLCNRLDMRAGARVGHGNLIVTPSTELGIDARIGHLNAVTGPFNIVFARRGAIGNRNRLIRAGIGVVTGYSELRLGELAKITSRHLVDMTSSLCLGDFTTMAGSGSQVWTHGYVHDKQGPGRYRIDGAINVGDNVYIGSACVLTAGITICNGAIVGAGSTVSRSLTEPALYVGQALRKLPRPKTAAERGDLEPVVDDQLIEPVYVKKRMTGNKS